MMKGDVDDLGRRVYAVSESVERDAKQPPFDEETFRQIYFYEPPPKVSLKSRLKGVRCSREGLLKVLPILEWLPRYRKKDLASDVIAGLTVGVMHIPQGMAYALLGGVPPVVGIYMAFFPVLVYIVTGTSRHVSMGTFAVVCMMVGKSVDSYSHEDRGGFAPTEIASAVCLVVGVWQVLLSIFRLGSLSVLLSQTLVSGFTTGAAVHVLTSQIRNLFGIKVTRYSGPLKIIYSYVDVIRNIRDLNVLATILSATFITFLVVYNEVVKPFIQKKCKRTVPIPVELLVVIVGTVLSQTLHMKEEYGLAVVDSVPTGLPEPSLPPLELLPRLVLDGLVVAVVAVSINISMASIFAQRLGYEIDGNQEILASGLGNVFSSFFSCMPFAASLSRSLIQESVGGKTQVTSVVSAASLAFVLLFVGSFFEPLPYCVLSTIIVVALKGMFVQMKELPSIYRNSKLDAFVWTATFLSVVILDIDYGLGIGLSASVSSLVLRGQKVDVVTLGRVPNSQVYLDANRFRKCQTLPNVLILQVAGGLHFANSSSVRKEIMEAFGKFRKDFPIDLVSPQKQNKRPSVIIDFSCVPFVDPSAVKSLKTVCDDVGNLQSNVFFSGCLPSVYDALLGSGLFDDRSKSSIFHSVHDAVEHAKNSSGEAVTEFISKF